MKTRMQNVAMTLDGIVVFGGQNPLTPANTHATALYTQIGTTATSLRAHADDQDSGNAEFRSGTLSRREASIALRDVMRPMLAEPQQFKSKMYLMLRKATPIDSATRMVWTGVRRVYSGTGLSRLVETRAARWAISRRHCQ